MGYEKHLKVVPGKDKGKIILFAISTCQWCRKTKNLFAELQAGYKYVDVDLLDGEAQHSVIHEVEKYNPKGSFPTILINGRCFVGFEEENIRRELSDGA